MKNKRIWELDFLRGISIILLVFDHLTCYLTFVPGFFPNYYEIGNPFVTWAVDASFAYWDSPIRAIGHCVFVTIFLLLVGISSTFSHNNVSRGIKVFSLGMCLTLVTLGLDLLGMEDVLILFGILHLIGVGVLLYELIDKAPCSKWLLITLGTLITVIGLCNNMFFPPYVSHIRSFTQFIELIVGTIISGGDSFGLFYVGIIFIGGFLGKTLYADRKSLLPKLDGKWNTPINYVGRHTLLIYCLTPIVVYGLIFIVCFSLGYRF